MSAAEESLRFTGMFESELLVELMLRFWNHPRANDKAFRNAVLESAAEVLRASIGGEQLMADVSPENMTLVAAVWFSEFTTLASVAEISSAERAQREEWLENIRRAIPSCFCDPNRLM